MPTKVPIVSLEELQTMHTGSLMSRRKALLACEQSLNDTDRQDEDMPNSPETGMIEFKDSPQWRQAYDEIKQVLATREHVPDREERRQIRKEKAREAKSGERRKTSK